MPNVVRCCVNGCRNKERGSSFSFFSLPKDTERRHLWLQLIGRPELHHVTRIWDRTFRVCSAHFEAPGMTELIMRKLMPFALPTKLISKRSQPCPVKYEDDTGYIDASTQTRDAEGKEWWEMSIKTEFGEPAPKRKRELRQRGETSAQGESIPIDLEERTLRSGTRIPRTTVAPAKKRKITKSTKN